jgi:hypothetical protein
LCHKAQWNRRIEINPNHNWHKEKKKELLIGKEGLMHRKKRPVEVESALGQSKSNKSYNRFRHFEKDKALMEFGILAVAFNIGKLHNSRVKYATCSQKSAVSSKNFVVFIIFVPEYYFSYFENYFFTKTLNALPKVKKKRPSF